MIFDTWVTWSGQDNFDVNKLSYIHTKSCCNDFEIGSLVGNWQSAKIELQQLKKWAITPQKIFQPWCCSP